MKGSVFASAVVSVALVAMLGTAAARMTPRQIYKTKAEGVVLIVAAPKGASSASAGSGSIIAPDGTIVTNFHVVMNPDTRRPFESIHVFLKPRRVTGDMNKDLSRHYTARVFAWDEALDIALLRMEKPPRNLTVITLGNPDDVGPGDETMAIGHPEQGGLWTITTGVIGAEFENFKGVAGKHVFQIETSLNRGNSGGPLFDVRGYQIGVNTAIARKGAGGVAITGVNFALKSSVVKEFAARHGLRLAYGPERIEEEPAMVASSGGERAEQQARPSQTPAASPPPADSSAKGKKVYGGSEYGGTITVEEDEPQQASSATRAAHSEEEGYEAKPPPRRPGVTSPARSRARRPLRFASRYRLPPRPYSFRRLLTAVDAVRGRAEEAFDDLEREIRRRRYR